MKLQLPTTSAVPAAVAAAAIAFALLLFPGGGTSVRSADVAPALRLVAGDVATVVRSPVPSVTKAQPKSVVASPSTGVAATPASTQQSSSSPARTHSLPAHRVVSRGPLTHAVKRTPVKPTPVKPPVLAAPRVITRSVKHGNGKARALGHLKKANGKAVGHRRKIAPHASSSHVAHGGGSKSAAAPAAAVSHGPPAVPPGQAKKTSDGNGASNGRGGKK